MQMATLQPDWNFLGLEIRAPLVEQAQQEKEAAGLTNLYFLFGNANVGVDALLWSLPTGALQRVSIQFPDPWFKKRHQKRRVVQPELVASLAQALAVGGQVILQSDVAEVAEAMCDRFTAHRDFQRTSPDWLPESPFPAQTDREQLTLSKGLSVYRAIYVRS
jgi:tRNA (guanine-N7-)-methyltransferase